MLADWWLLPGCAWRTSVKHACQEALLSLLLLLLGVVVVVVVVVVLAAAVQELMWRGSDPLLGAAAVCV